MGTTVYPLVVRRVIGDVVYMFVSSVTMNVYFDTRHVTNGCDIRPSLATNPPRVTISGSPHNLHSGDDGSRCTKSEIVTDIPGATGPTEGKEVVPYMGPRPPVGIHRYIFVLFQQRAPLGLGGAGHVGMNQQQQPISYRANFNTRALAHQLDLGYPVATVYFNAHKEPANRRR